jgi:hypothetical protein
MNTPKTLDELVELQNQARALIRKGSKADLDEALRLNEVGLAAFPHNTWGLEIRASALRKREAFEPGDARAATFEAFDIVFEQVRSGKVKGAVLIGPAANLARFLKSHGERTRALEVLEQVRGYVQYNEDLATSFACVLDEISRP